MWQAMVVRSKATSFGNPQRTIERIHYAAEYIRNHWAGDIWTSNETKERGMEEMGHKTRLQGFRVDTKDSSKSFKIE